MKTSIGAACAICCCLLIVGTTAFPRGIPPAKLSALPKVSLTDKSADTVQTVGDLSTVHAVGVAANPSNPDVVLYADETAVYELNKNTGESIMVAGAPSAGLLAMRSPVDGTGLAAKFKYITKIISRPSGLYVFDYDSLRKYDYSSKKVETVAELSEDDNSSPHTGAVSRDEKTVYWTSTARGGHLVKSMGIPNGKLSDAQTVTGGPTAVAHLELSSDEQEIYLADVDMGLIERVEISSGDISFVTQYGQADFYPGSMEVVNGKLYSVNRASLSINQFDLKESRSTPIELCDEKCRSKITNPFDLAFDSKSNQLYILDASYHPSLPTYNFSIKSLQLGDRKAADEDFDDMLQFYSRWFSEWRSEQ